MARISRALANGYGLVEGNRDAQITSEELLRQWCRFGWNYRGIPNRPQEEQDWYAERTRYELDLIISKDFPDFFLATSDMVRWAKDSGIPVGPGRGSVAASVVAWLLRITEVDPIRYPSLLFERFLDVTRSDPPDIDLDISDERRHEVREYMASRYGDECVGSVANFVRYRPKNSLLDVARVYNVPKGAKEIVSNLIIERSGGDSRFDSTLQDTVEMFPNAKEIFERFPDLWQATRLEGNVRGMSVHAAGLIVANSPLTDICAVYERDGRQVLSIDKYDCEYVDALKMDLLGLTTMGIIARALEMTGLTLEDLYAIPDNDPESLAVFRRGDVTGIFQFEGRATRLVNRDVRPDNFGEVTDINALSRPGPLFSGTTAEYCDVKHGKREPERFHPIIDEITRHSKGQIIYQEQILQVVRDVGGFDWTHAVEIRRIISKKMGEAAFDVSRDNFVEGAEKLHNINEELADKIWKRLVTSGTYAFVYAHSVGYSLIGLWCAWLKSHYTTEFYAASLARAGDEEQQFRLMRDAIAHDVAIHPPNLRHSKASWTAVPGLGLVGGWKQIPGIGDKMAERIETYGGEHFYPAEWESLLAIPGIGPKKIDAMREFAEARDPFGLDRTREIMEKTAKWIKRQRSVPTPTHDGAQVAVIEVRERKRGQKWLKGPRVVYAGMVKRREYQDAAENERSRSGRELDDILKDMKRPDLLEYCYLLCFDTTDEEVYLRINRFKFPELRRILESIDVNHDVVVCEGNKTAGFGTSIAVNKLHIIDPD